MGGEHCFHAVRRTWELAHLTHIQYQVGLKAIKFRIRPRTYFVLLCINVVEKHQFSARRLTCVNVFGRRNQFCREKENAVLSALMFAADQFQLSEGVKNFLPTGPTSHFTVPRCQPDISQCNNLTRRRDPYAS